MILTIMNWSYVFLLSYLFGMAVSKLIEKISGYHVTEWEIVIILGIMLLTVYAQIFSLFAPVGMWANIILVILGLIFAIVCHRNIACHINNLRKEKWSPQKLLQVIFTSIVILVFVMLSCQRALHADTDGYHAQAIRWIEDYGVIKGLGNLYHRLAYNSAFMSLQALFSWKFLINQSMHVINGFLCCVMFLYAVGGILKQGEKNSAGNLFRILLLIFITLPQSMAVMPSPNTDTFALLLVVFILSKWCDYLTEKERSAIPYAVLSVLAVFAMSIKLSTVLLIVLAIKPAYQMIKERKWEWIGFFLAMGIIVLAPFLCRNVLISGYLIYPYSAIDLFDVSWKMLPSVVECDKKEIMTWARALYDIDKSNYNLWQWFPIWWNEQEVWLRTMVVVNAVLLLPGVIINCVAVKHKEFDCALLMTECIILLFGWFLTAPLQRYGVVFLFLLPVSVASMVADVKMSRRILYVVELLAMSCCSLLVVLAVGNMEPISLKRSAYYVKRECEEKEWHGITVYLPIENGYMGYYYLPATQFEDMLEFIEPISAEIREGIRVKEEYANAQIDTGGRRLSVQ